MSKTGKVWVVQIDFPESWIGMMQWLARLILFTWMATAMMFVMLIWALTSTFTFRF